MFVNPAKLVMAALAAFVVMFLVDYLWWGVIFNGWAATHMPAGSNNSILYHGIAELCFAGMMALIYPLGYKGGSALMEGATFGALMGFVASVPSAIHHFASVGGSKAVPVFLIINTIVIGVIGGIVIGMVYGKAGGAKA